MSTKTCPECGGDGWVAGGEGAGVDDMPCSECQAPDAGRWEGGTGVILDPDELCLSCEGTGGDGHCDPNGEPNPGLCSTCGGCGSALLWEWTKAHWARFDAWVRLRGYDVKALSPLQIAIVVRVAAPELVD